ncbi:hypothetical protein D3C83_10460 [compost metagenome]
MVPGLAVADAAHRRHAGVEGVLFAQAPQLRHEARFEHVIEAPRDAHVQDLAIAGDERYPDRGVGEIDVLGLGEQPGQRLVGEDVDLQRALDALRVVGLEPRRRHGVHAREPRVHAGPAPLLGHGVDHEPHHRVGFRQVVQALGERLVIHHGAAHQ